MKLNNEKELLEFEKYLKEEGYVKYNQHYKKETFAYWKSFKVNDEKTYQVGVLFYDWREHKKRFNIPETIGLQFECMTHGEHRIDMSVCKENLSIDEFELMCKDFYESMKKYI